MQEVSELQQQLQSSEREKQTIRQQLTTKEAELNRAEETIMRDRQQMQQRVSVCISLCVLRLEVLLTTGDWATATADKKRSRAYSGRRDNQERVAAETAG